MALLQISEPGMSTAPHQHRLAVGIDLGTTNSLVASVQSGLARVLDDERGRALLPSVVRYLAEGGVSLGYEAQARQSEDPQNTIVSVKRFMGRGLKDLDKSSIPYRLLDEPGLWERLRADGLTSAARYSWEAVADGHLALYRAVLSRVPSSSG